LHSKHPQVVGQQVLQPLISCDRTAQFSRCRRSHRLPDYANVKMDKASSLDSELVSIYEQAVGTHTMLTQFLAQHNGFLQFGIDNTHRTPPIEFRAVLPKLERNIEDGLVKLMALRWELEFKFDNNQNSEEFSGGLPEWHCAELVELEGAGCRRKQKEAKPKEVPLVTLQICDSTCQWLNSIHANARLAFKKQQSEMCRLAATSPQFSLVLCPLGEFGARLAQVTAPPRASHRSACTERAQDLISSLQGSCFRLAEHGRDEPESDSEDDRSTRAPLSLRRRSFDSTRTIDTVGELSDEDENVKDPFVSVFNHVTNEDRSRTMSM